MNYRHAFHAGNFADVVKHAVLARILIHLCGKPAPFRVIDTHAGAGRYDLFGPEALRGAEWRDGIGRVFGAHLEPAVLLLLAPYLDVVAACNPAERLSAYPGSPAIVRSFLRAQDRLVACELEPGAAAALKHNFGHDRRIKVMALDGWIALNAGVPPKERRGLVLIDPPYEDAGDFPGLVRHLQAAHRKWAGGIYLLWYPIKQRQPHEALLRQLRRSGIAKILSVELSIAPAPGSATDPSEDVGRLASCGLIVVNPPWTLERELGLMLPPLAAILSGGGGGGDVRITWLAGER